MARSKVLVRAAILPILGLFFSVTGGCGSGPVADNPEIGAQRKQARIDAYGKAGVQNSRGQGNALNAQAAARRGNR